MEYRESPPPPDLAPFVRRFWTLVSPEHAPPMPTHGLLEAAAALERVVPDGRMELVVHLGDAFAQWRPSLGGGRLHSQPRALLAGQLDSPLFLLPGRRVDLFAIRFEPWGAAALLGLPPTELAGRIVPLCDLLGADADRLVHALAMARDGAGREAAAVAWCRARSARAAGVPAGLIAAVRLARREAARASVADLAACAGASMRQLERDFERHVGLAPKPFLRIARLQCVIAAIDAGAGGSLSRLAATGGYSDQSHLTREFLALAGTTPGRFLRERRGLSTLLIDPEPAGGVSARA